MKRRCTSSAESKRYASRPVRVAGAFKQLPREVQSLLRLCDGRRSLRRLREESGLQPRVFDRVLERLIALDFIEARTAPSDLGRAITWATQPVAAAPEAVVARAPTIEQPIAHAPTIRIAVPVLPSTDTTHQALTSQPLIDEPIIDDDLEPHDFSRDEERFFSRTIDHLLEPEERISARG